MILKQQYKSEWNKIKLITLISFLISIICLTQAILISFVFKLEISWSIISFAMFISTIPLKYFIAIKFKLFMVCKNFLPSEKAQWVIYNVISKGYRVGFSILKPSTELPRIRFYFPDSIMRWNFIYSFPFFELFIFFAAAKEFKKEEVSTFKIKNKKLLEKYLFTIDKYFEMKGYNPEFDLYITDWKIVEHFQKTGKMPT